MKMKPAVQDKPQYLLPSSNSIPSDRLADYSILIYGEKKIGKTSWASMNDKTLFFMCEPGGKALSIRQLPISTWEEFKGYAKAFIKSKDYRTGVIDTADICYKLCMKYVCKDLVIDHPSELDWGKGYEAVKDEFLSIINPLLHSGKGIIFISHSKEEEIKTRTGEKYHRMTPTMSGSAKGILEGVVDIWAYYTYENKQRVLILEGDDHIGAGHRLENHFRYSDGSSVQKVPMGKSKQEAYNNFLAAFNNKLPKGGQLNSSTNKKPETRKLVFKSK